MCVRFEERLATVYRLLEVLVEAGVCRPFVGPDRALRYVYCPPGHHHHLICEGCGRVVDVPDCLVVPPPGSFTVERHVLDFFGRCPDCAAAAAGRAPDSADRP
jgi:Fur family ferric uptake transcriptional regulator